MSDACQPSLSHRRRDLVAGGAVRDDQVRDLVLAGARGDRHAARDVRAGVRDEDLRAVHDPLPVAELGARLRRAGVRPGSGLGEPERGEPLPRGEVGNPLALLLLGPVEEDRHRPERGVRRHGDRDGGVDPAQLLDRERVRERVAAGAAVLLRDRDAHEPELRELGDDLVRESGAPGRAPRRPARSAPSASSRTVRRMSSCSSERSKFTPPAAARARRAGGRRTRSRRPSVVVVPPALEVGRSGDVEVRPRALADELLQEVGGIERRALAESGRVLHVRERGLDVAPVGVVEGEGPGVVAARLTGHAHLLQPVLVVGEEPGVEVPERDDDAAGQRREVEQVGGARAPRVPERVGEDEPALRIRVRHLDRLAVRGRDDVAGAVGPVAEHVLARGDDGRAREQAARAPRSLPDRASTAPAPPMSDFRSSIFARRLQVETRPSRT